MLRRRAARGTQLLALAAAGAAAAAFSGWLTSADGASGPSFCGGSACEGRSRRQFVGCAAEGKKGVTPILDDSDFDLGSGDGGAAKPPKKSRKDSEIEDLMKAADAFSNKIEKKRKRSSELDLTDDLTGTKLDESLEDDVYSDAAMMSTARSPAGMKVDTSVGGRLAKWLGETKELITNPTKLQLTYSVIFAASFFFLVLLGLLVFAMGGVRLRGDSLAVFKANQRLMNDAYYQQDAIKKENLRRYQSVEKLSDLTTEGGMGIRTFDEVNYGDRPPLPPEEIGPILK